MKSQPVNARLRYVISLLATASLCAGATHVAQAATLLDTLVPGAGSLDAIGHDPSTNRLYVHEQFGVEIDVLDTDGNMLGTLSPQGGSNDYDLDFTFAPLNVGGVTVPAGTLLIFNGDVFPETLFAVDVGTDQVLTSVELDSPSLVGGAQIPGVNRVATVQWTGDDSIISHEAQDGTMVGSFLPGPQPFDINFGDVDIAPDTGNLVLVSSSQNIVRELTPTGLCVRDIDVGSLGITNMSGVAIDHNTGNFWISSTSGQVYHLDPRPDPQPDPDNDGITSDADNCINVANPLQQDTDGDGLGNACDADIAPAVNDCVVNAVDLGALRLAFFSTPASPNWNPHADFNSDNVVNVIDLGIMRTLFFLMPGPSGEGNICTGCGI